MQPGDLSKEYQGKRDEELLRLAAQSEQLTPEARVCLTHELARRGIAGQEPQTVSATPVVPRTEPYAIGPPLAAETPKAPWPPKTAGRIAFFFGPFAGAQVAAVSLRRMGHHAAAKRVIFLALGMAVAESVILFFIPDALARIVGLGSEIAFLLVFPKFVENEFQEWETSHPGIEPSNGWRAIGVGIAGSVAFFVVVFIVMILLAAIFPHVADALQ